MIKAVIVDDEIDAVFSIELIINEYCSDVIIVGKANSAIEGKNQILKNKPDLVFLDIDMPRGTGFDMLEMLPEKNFDVIFVTAYSDFAIKAFKYSAVDYILKPIEIDNLINAVKRVQKKRASNTTNSAINYEVLMENIKDNRSKKIIISNSDGIEFVDVSDIIRFQAEGSYTQIFLSDGVQILVSKHLKEFQDLLTEDKFYRPHNSHLINLANVKRYVQRDGGYIVMKDNSEVPISRRKKDLFIDIMSKFIY